MKMKESSYHLAVVESVDHYRTGGFKSFVELSFKIINRHSQNLKNGLITSRFQVGPVRNLEFENKILLPLLGRIPTLESSFVMEDLQGLLCEIWNRRSTVQVIKKIGKTKRVHTFF